MGEFVRLNIDKSKQFDNEEDQNKFKGDMFEVCVEFFIKHFEPILGIKNYSPNMEEDYGTDGLGGAANNENEPIAVQSKFKSDPTYQFNLHDLSSFLSNAAWKYGVHNPNNLVFISTTYDLYYTIEKNVGGKIRHINLNQIEKLVNNTNTNFFGDFWEALTNSIVLPEERKAIPPLWEHQKEIKNTVDNFLIDEIIERGQVIVPTGGGKTTNEREAINSSIVLGGLIQVVMAPRIVLVNQILNEMHDYKIYEWDSLLIRSGMDEQIKYYSDDDYIDTEVMATTSVEDIIEAINNALKTGKPLVMFSTYHSADKIGKALLTLGIKANLCIGDEAHNMVGEGFNELLDPNIIPTDKWLFFTATRIVSSESFGKGMNNEKLFGKKLCAPQPIDLIKRGVIVQPRVHIVHLAGDCNDVECSLALIESVIKKQMEDQKHEEFRIIVACKSVEQSHILSKNLKPLFPGWSIDALSSDTDMMKCEHGFTGLDGKDRQKIFDRYSNNKFAILLHYNILSEGINLPGTTAVLTLRNLSPVRMVQFSGRSSRVNPTDREELNKGNIKPGNIYGWIKPFGWIIVHDDYSDNYVERVTTFIDSLRRGGFDVDVDHTFITEDRSITIKANDDIVDLFPEFKKEIYIVKQAVEKIEKNIVHDLEEEERALIRQDQLVLNFVELPKGTYESYGSI